MAELADALDSGSSGHYARAGSSPVIRRNAENGDIEGYHRFLLYKNNKEVLRRNTPNSTFFDRFVLTNMF